MGMTREFFPVRGRGASDNPANRFIPIYHERDQPWDHADDPAPATRFFRDNSRSALASNDSPDIPFTYSLNPYRGCEHGCAYCYARPTHEYLGFSAGLDFETRILVKEDLPELLRKELLSPKWVPQSVSISGVTDPYQPVERRVRLTRRCLEVLAEFRNPVAIVTKNALVTRDADLLAGLAQFRAAAVFVSVTTLDSELARRLEPRASAPAARLRAVEELAKAGVPAGVFVAPVIPGLNDHEMPGILRAAAGAGACCAGYMIVRLPGAVAGVFEAWLEQHYPDRKEKVLGRVREAHGGELNDPRFGMRMRGEGPWADLFRDLFRVTRRKAGIPEEFPQLSADAFRRPDPPPAPPPSRPEGHGWVQRSLFDDLE